MTVLRIPVQMAVPPEWTAQLAELSPPTNRFKWLKLLFEPGYEWEPCERLFIYEMTPARAMNGSMLGAILEQLQHPAPPSAMGNYYDSVKGEFVRNPDCLITERAYWLYQETQCWGRPYWVIQGEKGGHKRWFSPIEKKFLKLAGLPSSPPEPGDLPYAPFDERVLNALRTHDLLQGEHGGIKRQKALLGPTSHSARLAAEEERFRTALVKWLGEQVAEVAPDVEKAFKRSKGNHSDRSAAEMDEAAEQAEEQFIRTGRTDGLVLP
jgi:hypothetical protein